MKMTKKSNAPVKHRRATCLTPSGHISYGMISQGDIVLDFVQRDTFKQLKPEERHAHLAAK